MIRIDRLRLQPGEDASRLAEQAAKLLRVRPEEIQDLHVVRRSIDARGGHVIWEAAVHLTLPQEGKVLRRVRDRRVQPVKRERYPLPAPLAAAPARQPVVVGAGPAGLFCALLLARAGARPIVLERGAPVEQRRQDVERFWSTGALNTASNVQFGEGGAGTFSDGKLNTGTRDPGHRYILGKLVELGAPESILIDAKPHAGTDKLFTVMQNLRRELERLGAELRFGHQVTDLAIENGALRALEVTAGAERYVLPADAAVLALGHSARDTVEMLFSRGVPMEAKAFAVGVRIEHRQRDMDAARYGAAAGHPALPPATYTASRSVDGGRHVFSFCVCPGGQVVAAASEPGRLVTNGMSLWARDGENINGGLLVNVTPEDFGGDGPLAGIAFQRRLEEAAYALGGGGYIAPAQLVGDFLAGRPSAGAGRVRPTYRPGVRFTDLRRCLPPFLCDALAQALPQIDEKLIPGFACPDAVLTAVESRSSAPVRIPRDPGTRQSAVAGLYPCGEGAGYAGGILSAAADGIHTAEAILEVLRCER